MAALRKNNTSGRTPRRASQGGSRSRRDDGDGRRSDKRQPAQLSSRGRAGGRTAVHGHAPRMAFLSHRARRTRVTVIGKSWRGTTSRRRSGKPRTHLWLRGLIGGVRRETADAEGEREAQPPVVRVVRRHLSHGSWKRERRFTITRHWTSATGKEGAASVISSSARLKKRRVQAATHLLDDIGEVGRHPRGSRLLAAHRSSTTRDRTQCAARHSQTGAERGRQVRRWAPRESTKYLNFCERKVY